MKRPLTLLSAAAFLLAAVLAIALRPAGASAQGAAPASATCTFTNPGFSGKCVENVPIPEGGTPATACRGVLACLNNPMCAKTYCQATTIRTGWKLESAAPTR